MPKGVPRSCLPSGGSQFPTSSWPLKVRGLSPPGPACCHSFTFMVSPPRMPPTCPSPEHPSPFLLQSPVRYICWGGAQRILTGSPGAPWGPGKPLGPGGPSFPRGPGGPRSPCRRAEEEGQAPEKGCFLLVCESGGDSEPWGGMGPLGNLWGHST